MENKRLTDEEVLALKKILIKDNCEITAISYEYGYGGRGNTNTSCYSPECKAVIPLSELNGRNPRQFGPYYFQACGWEVRFDVSVKLYAVVSDVIYLVADGKVKAYPVGSCYYYSSSIAYDTEGCFYLYGVCKKADDK